LRMIHFSVTDFNLLLRKCVFSLLLREVDCIATE
jgi:hypothetical protein